MTADASVILSEGEPTHFYEACGSSSRSRRTWPVYPLGDDGP
jgi:hypothetical protein